MTLLSGLGIILSLVFGCLLLALVAELYYLLWWKKQTVISNSNNRIEENYSNHTKEMFYLFCWEKPPTSTINTSPNSHTLAANLDLEAGGLANCNKEVLVKAVGDEGVEAELMRLHNMGGPPRYLFTIKEETLEDLESIDDAKFKSPQFKGTPKVLGPKCYHNCNSNPLFESSVEGELSRLRSSPPPKFKFLRDAEEKLYRKLIEEARSCGVFQEATLDIPQSCSATSVVEGEEGVVRHTTAL
ncbi:hypothetical protein vseg_021083 [Gypsophila vaccaria]